jgi:hypothetical protein
MDSNEGHGSFFDFMLLVGIIGLIGFILTLASAVP